MNPLVFLSFFSFMSFALLAVYSLRVNHRVRLNRLTAAVNLAFAWWNFGLCFFYAAPNEQSAWFWLKFSSPGWILFPAIALHYYIIVSDRRKLAPTFFHQALIYAWPSLLLLRTLLLPRTIIARDVVQSDWGLGWTTIGNPQSVWWWFYTVYLAVWMLGSVVLTFSISRRSVSAVDVKAHRHVLVVICLVASISFTTDMLLPLLGTWLPPVANIVSLLYAVVFLRNTRKFNLLSRTGAVSSDLIFGAVMEPVVLLDMNGTIVRCNQAAAVLFAGQPETLFGRPLIELLESPEQGRKGMQRLLQGRRIQGEEAGVRDLHGDLHLVLFSACAISDEQLGKTGIVISFRDVTARSRMTRELEEVRNSYRQLSEELYDIAHFDPLTHLPNRRMFFLRAAEHVTAYESEGRDFAVIYLDLDGFKRVNDDFGHDIGDRLLVETAVRLSLSLSDADLLARMGGDEFVMIQGDVKDATEVTVRIGELQKRFGGEIRIGAQSFRIGISAGYALFSDAGELDTTMRKADQRMYVDKQRVKTQTEVTQ